MNPLAGYDNSRVLVTGAFGYIGSLVVDKLSSVCRVRAVDLPLPEALQELPWAQRANVEILTTDLRDGKNFPAFVRDVDVIFHFAAQTSHYVANQDPLQDFDASCRPLLNLLAALKEVGTTPRIVLASSATVVGMTEQFPVDEGIPCHPVTIYDCHKLNCENYLSFYGLERGGQAAALRLANVYGPGLRATKNDRGILNLMCGKALAGEPLTVYGDGQWLRDYVFIDDVVDGFLLAGSPKVAFEGMQIFNICTGTSHRFVDVARQVADLAKAKTGRDVAIVHQDKVLSKIDTRQYQGNAAKAERILGWRARTQIAAGLKRLMEAVHEQ